MKFTEVTREEIMERIPKPRNHELKEALIQFLTSGYKCARVDDTEGYYNNNNDMRRAIQSCIKKYEFPMIVFMYQGLTYIERL